MSNKDLGNWGEDLAAKFLKKKGYKILARNYRNRFGEIDIIASKKRRIMFIEVKTRTGNYFGWPEEAVDEKKKEKLEYLADCYLEEKKFDGDFQFDVISIIKHRGKIDIDYFENI